MRARAATGDTARLLARRSARPLDADAKARVERACAAAEAAAEAARAAAEAAEAAREAKRLQEVRSTRRPPPPKKKLRAPICTPVSSDDRVAFVIIRCSRVE